MLASHIPIIEIKSNFLEVTTPHEMKGFEHYILKHIILDKTFNIISEKNLILLKIFPSQNNISGYSESLYVLSICNIHDTWFEHVKLP